MLNIEGQQKVNDDVGQNGRKQGTARLHQPPQQPAGDKYTPDKQWFGQIADVNQRKKNARPHIADNLLDDTAKQPFLANANDAAENERAADREPGKNAFIDTPVVLPARRQKRSMPMLDPTTTAATPIAHINDPMPGKRNRESVSAHPWTKRLPIRATPMTTTCVSQRLNRNVASSRPWCTRFKRCFLPFIRQKLFQCLPQIPCVFPCSFRSRSGLVQIGGSVQPAMTAAGSR